VTSEMTLFRICLSQFDNLYADKLISVEAVM